ncbi:hypothetical protein XELAEV_18019355mg [Xenopus laevis]|uniref:G-protein coupled receptors family 1 profile domain-containing protein n=1 Tax=Xenopus laevis TaxID=8355 RepID=A0A974HUM7_XENLA|nr:hypothetical protein XELAEV_18019355mg [Xenopus laevis]
MILFTVVPTMLYFLLQGRGVISFSNCLTQLFFFGLAAGVECLLLTVMSCDWYFNICRPLHYISIMDLKFQFLLVTSCWLLGFATPCLITCSVLTLRFFGPHNINHFFCDTDHFVELSCSDTILIDTEILVLAFVFIIVTYCNICLYCPLSHLTVVCTFYGSLIINYMIPISGETINTNKYISLLYTVIMPLFNLLIYTLRNKDNRCTSHCYMQKPIV